MFWSRNVSIWLTQIIFKHQWLAVVVLCLWNIFLPYSAKKNTNWIPINQSNKCFKKMNDFLFSNQKSTDPFIHSFHSVWLNVDDNHDVDDDDETIFFDFDSIAPLVMDWHWEKNYYYCCCFCCCCRFSCCCCCCSFDSFSHIFSGKTINVFFFAKVRKIQNFLLVVLYVFRFVRIIIIMFINDDYDLCKSLSFSFLYFAN